MPTIPSAPSGENTSPALSVKLPLSGSQFGQLLNLLKAAGTRWPFEGMLTNYYIAASVSANDLTVALKTKAGADPSATDPLYVAIGDTSQIRTISGALSKTIVDGTNWFNAGSAELATKTIDYFVYVGYRVSDTSMFIGISRVPHGHTYSEFSATSTNEKYLAYSGAAPAASDEMENIGRISATLSAGAGYTWSISGTGDPINHPIFESELRDWAPTASALAPMTYTSVTVDYAKYQVRRGLVQCYVRTFGTIGGTPTSDVYLTLPVAHSAAQPVHVGGGAYDNSLMKSSNIQINAATAPANTAIFRLYDSSNWTAGANEYALASFTLPW